MKISQFYQAIYFFTIIGLGRSSEEQVCRSWQFVEGTRWSNDFQSIERWGGVPAKTWRSRQLRRNHFCRRFRQHFPTRSWLFDGCEHARTLRAHQLFPRYAHRCTRLCHKRLLYERIETLTRSYLLLYEQGWPWVAHQVCSNRVGSLWSQS